MAESFESNLPSGEASGFNPTRLSLKQQKNLKFHPWWNNECSIALSQRNNALQLLNRKYSKENAYNFKKSVEYFKKVLKKSKSIYLRKNDDNDG